MVITVCIGSGCHVKGSYHVIDVLKELVAAADADMQLDLEACFCQNKCTEGVVVRFGDRVVTHVTPTNIKEHYQKALAHEAGRQGPSAPEGDLCS